MKKLITISTACIIAGLWLTSCSSHMLVVKRHYNNGYYVSHVNHKGTSTASTSTVVANQPEISEVTAKPSNASLPENLEQTAPVAQTSNAFTSTKEEQNHRISAKPSVVSSVSAVTGFMMNKTKEAANPMSFSIKSKIKAHKTDEVVRDGLSLFWIIILILLILWVLGLLGGGWGLGILINLLLLFALILLILWLLRVL